MPVLTVNCDVITETNFREMLSTFDEKRADVLVGVRPFNTFILRRNQCREQKGCWI